MNRFLSLSKVMMKSSLNSLNSLQGFKRQKTDSTLKKFGAYLLIGVLIVYLAGLVYFPSKYIIESMVKMGQPSLVITLVNSFTPMAVIFFSIASIPGIFYFSKDIESYIPLPFKAWEITAAKFVTAYLQTLVSISVLIVPIFFNYFTIVKPDFLFIITAIVTTLILPIIPLAISLLIVAVLMRFVPFLKNKNLYVYLSTAIILIPTFILSFSLSSINENMDIAKVFYDSLVAMDDSIFKTFSLFLPTSKMMTLAMVENKVLLLILAIGISLIIALAVIILIQPLYFESVIGLNEESSKKRRLRLNEMDEHTQVKSFKKSFMIYDLKTILRTPIFAMNYFSALIIIPIAGLIPLFVGDLSFKVIFSSLGIFKDKIHEFFYVLPLIEQWELLALVGLAIGVLIANFESSSFTAISREGISMKQFLSFPIKFSDIAHAKAQLSIIFSLIYCSIFLLFGIIIARPRIDSLLIFTYTLILGIIISTYLAIAVDTSFPKLAWDTEQQAVKGNFIQVLVMLPLMFFPFVLWFFYLTLPAVVNLFLTLLLVPVLTYFLIQFTTKQANHSLVQRVQNL